MALPRPRPRPRPWPWPRLRSPSAGMLNVRNVSFFRFPPRTEDRSVPSSFPDAIWQCTVLYLRARRSMLICHHVLAATNWFCWHCTVVLQQQCHNATLIILISTTTTTTTSEPYPGSIPGEGHLSRYVTSHPGQLSLAIPSRVGAMSTSQRAAAMPCGWRVTRGPYLSALVIRGI